jgi:putative DNA primase/helicase
MKIDQLAAILDCSVKGRWINVPGPGHSPSDRSLGVRFVGSAPNGFWTHSLAGDPPEKCRKHVKRLLATRKISAEKIATGQPETSFQTVEPNPLAQIIWAQASPVTGSLAEGYLNSRECVLPATATSVLRFHPLCPFGAGKVPAMIALMQHVITDEPTGIHRTALNLGQTGKVHPPCGPKRMLGSSRSAAIKLQPHNGVLGVAEGIETALSASQLFNVPVWALLSAGGIRSCPLIPGVKQLFIFADHDEAGLTAARQCAIRYSNSGVPTTIRHPPTPNADYNDVLKERKKCQ